MPYSSCQLTFTRVNERFGRLWKVKTHVLSNPYCHSYGLKALPWHIRTLKVLRCHQERLKDLKMADIQQIEIQKCFRSRVIVACQPRLGSWLANGVQERCNGKHEIQRAMKDFLVNFRILGRCPQCCILLTDFFLIKPGEDWVGISQYVLNR